MKKAEGVVNLLKTGEGDLYIAQARDYENQKFKKQRNKAKLENQKFKQQRNKAKLTTNGWKTQLCI